MLIEGLITKGNLLAKHGRPVEGNALAEGARRVAVERGFPEWEARALIAMSLRISLGDPRAAIQMEREAIDLVRRIGRRDMELLLIGNAGEDSIRTGDWEFQATEFASLDELEIEPAIRLPMESTLSVIAIMRGEVDGDAIEIAYVEDSDIEDHETASVRHDLRGWIAFAEGRFKEASEAWFMMASMSALNAPYVLPRAAHAAILAGDRAGATQALERLDATGAHGRALDVDRTAIRAGLAALDGGTAEAVAGFRAALAGWRELGLPWDEAITSLEFARLVGAHDPEARDAARSARVILERLASSSHRRDDRCRDRRVRRTFAIVRSLPTGPMEPQMLGADHVEASKERAHQA